MLSAVIHGFMILLGILLIVAYSQMIQSMPNISMTSDVGRAMEGLYTMGVMFLSVGVTLAILKVEHAHEQSAYVVYFLVLLGVVLTTLSAILVSKTSGVARNWAIGILVLGLLFLVGSGSLIAVEKSGKFSMEYCSL